MMNRNNTLISLKSGKGKLSWILALITFAVVEGFVPSSTWNSRPSSTRWLTSTSIQLRQTNDNNNNNDESRGQQSSSLLWNPPLRRIMGSVATLGALETSYLTYNKVIGAADLCTVNGNCASVLNGPYAVIPFTDIPLAALGLLAYITTVVLSLGALSSPHSNMNDTGNRIALVGVTTAMGTFSVFLMSLIFGVLHETCPFCIASAIFSLTLAGCAWLGGALPPSAPNAGLQAGLASFVATTLAAVVIFVTAGDSSTSSTSSPSLADAFSSSSGSSTLLASNTAPKEGFSPPPITTASSERAVALSTQLQALNAKMYGAYWCSHCYDQKERLGKEAFARVQYIECSQDGKNSQRSLCQERDVPGYPTWEINGKLFPGERELDELEEIIVKATSTSAKD